ncbi:MAG: hypothetical protein L3J06_03400 [Cyclobacteriaceae bacterium]|nr:hypothetical protein [Cyclobacteriaceae bacterium]
MKNSIIKNNLIAMVLSSLVLFSCYNDDRFLDDNLITTGKDFPVVASLSADVKDDAYVINEEAVVEDIIASYWSLGVIKELNIYETISHLNSEIKETVSSTPYSPNFVDSLRADVFIFDYTPPQVEAQTNINVEFEVENENGLTKSRSFNMYYDVIISGNEKSYAPLDTVAFGYTYWSGSVIDGIDLVKKVKNNEGEIEETLIQTMPAQPAFSGGFVLDTYSFSQLVSGMVIPADSVITFEVQLINNAQADTIKSSFTFNIVE